MRWRRTSTAPARRSSCSPASGISAIRNITSIGSRLEELKKHDFLNPDMSSLELYPGIDLIVAGKLAMGQSIGARVPADSKTTNGRIGCMVMPVYGKGKLAGKPIFDAQGLGISTECQGSEGGGGLPRISAIAGAAEGLLGEDRLDPDQQPASTPRSSPTRRCSRCGRTGDEGDNIPYLSNVVPGQFYEQALLPTAQQVVAGKMHRRAGRRRWRPRSPRNGATSIRTWSTTTRSGRRICPADR